MTTDTQLPFSIVVPTAYGSMIVNRNDINQTQALVRTGYAIDHRDIALLCRIVLALEPNPIVVDVGANFGTYSLGLADALKNTGKIHAFEPQRVLFNMLAGSVAMNSLLNVYCHNIAVGDHEGRVEVPQYDYFKPLNFGSVEFTGQQREKLSQTRSSDADPTEYVPLTTLDSFGFNRLDLLKIDVEGMEGKVLKGAQNEIGRYRPVIFTEFIKSDPKILRQQIVDAGYVIYENGMNYLCFPEKYRGRINMGKNGVELASRKS